MKTKCVTLECRPYEPYRFHPCGARYWELVVVQKADTCECCEQKIGRDELLYVSPNVVTGVTDFQEYTTKRYTEYLNACMKIGKAFAETLGVDFVISGKVPKPEQLHNLPAHYKGDV